MGFGIFVSERIGYGTRFMIVEDGPEESSGAGSRGDVDGKEEIDELDRRVKMSRGECLWAQTYWSI